MIFSEIFRQHLGCWKDNQTRAISNSVIFKDDPVNNCHDYAAGKGYTVFGVQVWTSCFTASDARYTYKKYGKATNCEKGGGGGWALDMYCIIDRRLKQCLYRQPVPGIIIFFLYLLYLVQEPPPSYPSLIPLPHTPPLS